MFGKVCLRDIQGTTYIFKKSGKTFDVIINGQRKGTGKLVTPLHELSVFSTALFTIGDGNFKTDPLKGVFVD